MLWYGAPCCSAHTYMIAITALFIRGVSADADGCARACARACKPPPPKRTFTVTCTDASSRFSHQVQTHSTQTQTLCLNDASVLT